MRVFIICNSADLPTPQQRNANTIYFVYDTLDVYFGRTQYAGLYCIVEEVPDGTDPDAMPAKNMLYFKMNGDVWVVDKEIPKKIAQIQDPSMCVYLEKAGTTFLLRSGYRYIDKQTKAISLPYQNGINQFSAMVDKPVEFTNDTIMLFNEETGEFEPEGLRHYDEFGRNPEIMKYTAKNTKTVNTYIQNDHIHADVKISNKYGNVLQALPDGLYASATDFVNVNEFENLLDVINSQVAGFQYIMEQLQEYIHGELQLDITLSDETLKQKIRSTLEKYASAIDQAIYEYDQVLSNFHNFENELVEYIRVTLDDLRADTISRIEDVHYSWGFFTDDFITTIEKVANKRYRLTVPFVVEDNHNLRYIISNEKIYFYNGQLADEYTQFNSGDVINNVNIGKTINIVYCYEYQGNSYVESCSYCVAE